MISQVFLSNEQVAERDGPPTVAPGPHISALGAFVREKFEFAKRERASAERRMLAAIRQRSSQYTPAKLAAIQEVMGKGADPPYPGLTESRCEAIYAWLTDGILPPGQFPASIEPTPVPTLPDFIQKEISERVVQEIAARAEALILAGESVSMADQVAAVQLVREELQEAITKETLEQARESAEKMFVLIKDQFAEGGWENALRESLHDLVDVGTGIMRGPVLRSVPRRLRKMNPMTRRHETIYTQEIICQWDRLVPLRFYPSPDATRRSMPWYVYLNSSTRRDLSSLLGVEGYDQVALRAVLREYSKGYREQTTVEAEKATLEERMSVLNSELIDRLEFGGSVPGWMLTEWGMEGDLDPEMEYEALVWVVGTHVIKAILNPDPVGLNYIFSAGFAERPDSFWAYGVPDKVRHTQNIACIAARNLVMNAALASGPLTEINKDRMATGSNFAVRPWAVLYSTTNMMAEGKAMNFYQPQMHSTKLIEILDFCQKLADYESGIPRILYAGESGAETASATSMLMSQASKGGQNIIRNIDTGLIIPAVMAQYQYNLQYSESDEEIFGDHTIIARGSNSMIAKETKVTRLKEILRDMNNPADLEVAPPDIRARLWKEAVSALGLDPKLLGEDDEIEARARQLEAKKAAQEQMSMQEQAIPQMKAEQQMGMAQEKHRLGMQNKMASHNQQMMLQRDKAGTRRTPPAAQSLDGAGNQVAGRDYSTQNSQRGSTPG